MTQQYCLLLWLRGFPLWAFPTTISSLTSPRSSPRSISPKATAAHALGLLHNPQTPAPSCCALKGIYVSVQGMSGYGKDCLILISFRLLQISCFTLSLKCFSSDSDNCRDVGIGRLFQFAHLLGADQVLPTLSFPLLDPSSY